MIPRGGTRWSQTDDAALDKALRECDTVEDAAARLTRELGREITRHMIRRRCIIRGLGLPVDIMGRPARVVDRRHSEKSPIADIPVHVDLSELAPKPRFGVVPSTGGGVPFEGANVSDLDYEEEHDTDAGVAPAPMNDRYPVQLTPREETQQELRERRHKEQIRDLEADKKRLLQELHDREEQLGIFDEIRRQPILPPMFIPREGRGEGKRRQGTPCIVLSDWHVEEPVRPESVNGLNEYNLDIADACIDKCADAFEWLGKDPRYECREAIIALLGDMLSGWIHDELKEANFLSPVQAIMWLQERIERMLRKILAITNYERILVVCCDGNHGRLSHKIRVSTRTANSIEWLLYKSLASRFKDEKRLVFQIAEGEWSFVDIYKHTIGFTHGDSFRYLGGVGGLLIPVRRGVNEVRKYRPLDLTIMGHFHQRLDIGDIIVNGSMIGINPYAMHIHAAPEPRQQTWFMLDSERWRAVSAPVWL